MQADPRPSSEMNMTPLIDVLLVLLVLFVITIPASTHSVDIDSPSECNGCIVDNLKNRLVLDDNDQLMWNGTKVERGQLVDLLTASSHMPVEPELQFAPSARASYDAAAHTVALIKASGVTRFGFVGNELYRRF